MKKFRSEQYGFEIDVPYYWSCPRIGLWNWLFSSKELIFKSRPIGFTKPNPSEFLIIKVVPSSSRPDLLSIEASFRNHALRIGHKNIETGTIRVDNEDHFWTRYLMGKSQSLQTLVGYETVKKIKLAYHRELKHLSDEEFVEDSYNNERGPVVKQYFLVFNRKMYDIMCALGFGTVSEVKEDFSDKESTYDEVVSTFRPID